MSVLYDYRMLIEKKIQADGLDEIKVKGEIGLRTGRLVSLISVRTPDDPVAIGKMKQAAKDILGISL